MASSWSGLFGALVAGVDLSEEDTAWAMDKVMSGAATQAQIAGLAIGLRAKGETPAEISGMAGAMLAHAKRITVPMRAVDVVGTGGDQASTVNISTMAAIVTAAAGFPVIKHGGRAASSRSGTADVLEELGVVLELAPEAVRRCAIEVGIGFCFAPAFHPALRHTSGPRRELAIPTVFNILGPLTNPAQPAAAMIGCANERLAPVMAQVFARRGTSALVVRGDDGLDELTTTSTSTVWTVQDGAVDKTTVDPEAFGIARVDIEALRGGDAGVNAEVVRELVAGKPGAVRDAVLLNTAGAITAYRGVAGSLDDSLRAGLVTAAEAIDCGAAATLLREWPAFTQRLATR